VTADSALLCLMWLASPALPVGGFSYSDGLESAVDAALVHDEGSASDWLEHQLELQLARGELPLLIQAFDAWERNDGARVIDLNTWLLCTRESAEPRAQSEQMGRSMQQWLRNSAERSDARIEALGALAPAPSWPLAFALAGVLAGASAHATGLAYAFGWAENMVQAALKIVPLGQAAGQRVLTRLVSAIPHAVAHAASLDDAARQSFAPMLAVLSARHETQYSRLFRS
jgi:urease accessory protein